MILRTKADAAGLLAMLRVYAECGIEEPAAVLRADLSLNGKRWYAALRELGDLVQRKRVKHGRTYRYTYSLATVGNVTVGTLGNEAQS